MSIVVSQRFFVKTNPATGEDLATYLALDSEAITEIVKRSKIAQSEWGKLTLKKRAGVLKALVSSLQNNAQKLAECISRETGKPISEAYETELVPAVSVLSYYAKFAPKALSDKALSFDKSLLMGRTHYKRCLPYGVVGIISPWNFPLATPVSGIASSLMAGNSVILKPSELTPETGILLVNLFQDVFRQFDLPENLLQCVTGDGLTGQYLCESAVDFVIFTGSSKTGQLIQNHLNQRGIGVSLELGGSDPMIILPDANLDMATSYALWGRFTNAGQLCAAVKRLIIPKQHADRILLLLKDKVEALRVGPPSENNIQMGPVINEAQRNQLLTQIQDAVEKGARVITGGKALKRSGYFVAPTILTDVFLNSRVMQEEVFGPVLPVVTYDSIEEAIAIANHSPFGLTASVFGPTQDAEAVARQLHAGCVVVNDVGSTSYAMPLIPWRGWKASGPGGSHGLESLLELTRQQTVTINWFEKIPLFQKAFWHFDKQEHKRTLGEILLHTYATESWLDKANPKLLFALWQNQSKKKL